MNYFLNQSSLNIYGGFNVKSRHSFPHHARPLDLCKSCTLPPSKASVKTRAGLYGDLRLCSYGTLLGSSIFQSFVNGIVSYRSLTRPQFSTLQQAIFPIYFSIQSALPVVMAITYPGLQTPSGLAGLLARENRFSALVPIVTMFALNITNLLVVGPATTKVMRERKHQGMLLRMP